MYTELSQQTKTHVRRADTQEAYDAEKAALDKVLTPQYTSTVYALTIGSESLYNGIDACDILPRIVDARSTFGSIVKRVGTVDSWNKFQDGSADPFITGNCEGQASVPGTTFLYVRHCPVRSTVFTDSCKSCECIWLLAGNGHH